MSEAATFECADGAILAGHYFGSDRPRGVIVIAAAMAVPRRFYRRLAEHLSAGGYACLCFDYRGIGESRSQTSDVEMSFYAWGEQDIGAAVREARRRVPGLPCAVLGHSAGGQLVGMSDEAESVDALVMVACGTAYWGHWPMPARIGLLGAWFVVIPTVGRLLRRMPGALLGSSEGVPATIAREWARCARDPRYIRGKHRRASDERYDRFAAPTLIWSMEDDRYAPAAATRALVDLYPQLAPRWRSLKPAEIGRDRVGHFGWFRASSQPLWDETLDWLNETLA